MARPLVVLCVAVTLLSGSWALGNRLYKKPFQRTPRTPGSTRLLPHGALPKHPYPYKYNGGFFSSVLHYTGGQRHPTSFGGYRKSVPQQRYKEDLYTNTISQISSPTPKPLYKKYTYKVLNTVAPSYTPSTISPFKTFVTSPTSKPVQLQQRKVFQAVPTPFRNEPKTEKLVRLPPVESRENNIIDEDNSVLDFSSGNAEVKESTVSKVNETDPNQGERGFSSLQEATMFAGLEGAFEGQNVTIFSPDNKAFETSNFDYKSVPIPELRRILMRHIVKGIVMLKDLKSGPLETIGGEVIQIKLNEPSGVSIVRSSGEIRIKLGNVNTKFGLVHIIESVIV